MGPIGLNLGPTLNRDGRFGSKVGQIGPKSDNSWTFSDQISVHFGSASQNVLKFDLILKRPGFVPFRANLKHFEPKSSQTTVGDDFVYMTT